MQLVVHSADQVHVEVFRKHELWSLHSQGNWLWPLVELVISSLYISRA